MRTCMTSILITLEDLNMQPSEFFELLYYHIIWHWDKGLIIALLFLTTYNTIRFLQVLKDITEDIEDGEEN